MLLLTIYIWPKTLRWQGIDQMYALVISVPLDRVDMQANANANALQCLQPLATSNFPIYLDLLFHAIYSAISFWLYRTYLCAVYCGSFDGYNKCVAVCMYLYMCILYHRPIPWKWHQEILHPDSVTVPGISGKESDCMNVSKRERGVVWWDRVFGDALFNTIVLTV